MLLRMLDVSVGPGADQHPGPGAGQSGARGNTIRAGADQRREPHGAPGADQRRWSSGRAGRPGFRVVKQKKTSPRGG